MAFKLIEATDEHMVRPRVRLPGNDYFNPSASSVRYLDKHGISRVEGTCMRASYYRYTGEDALPTDAYSQWIFALGKSVENILVEQWKQMGIWIANNVKYYDPVYRISGELDVLVSDPQTQEVFAAEVKSFYGYYATKEICGNTKQAGKPKTPHLLQVLLYLDVCKRHGILDYAKLIYYARDSASRKEFNIRIVEDGEHKRPEVDGVIDYRFTLEEIYDRYAELQALLERKELPAAEFEMKWDAPKVKKFFDLKEVSKTAYEAFQKNPDKNPVGDWQCRYCSYTHVCWK